MTPLILICVAAFVSLLWILRTNRISLGLPVAYLYSLLLIHLPGAVAHVFGGGFLMHSDLVRLGMQFATLGTVCFVVGVWFARRRSSGIATPGHHVDRPDFWWACLIGGWLLIYGLSPLYHIPSLSAAADKGGAIWILGVLLGLRAACRDGDLKRIAIWSGALLVYPILMLLLGGFLSYGSAAIIIACAVLTVSVRSRARMALGLALFVFVGLSIFVNYFEHRANIRHEVWGGAPLEARVDSVLDTATDFQWLDLANPAHLVALDMRLNQNFFVGLAAKRIQQGQVSYLEGASIWNGLIALVPRAFWPDKPVSAGSPMIVSRMTGLWLSKTTSFGVGNVMEFQINFGYVGVIVGFLLLGWLIGSLDLKAAVAEQRGDLGRVILYFLPCVALIQPNGSIVDIASGSAAALAAAYGWKWVWGEWAAYRARFDARLLRRRTQFAPRGAGLNTYLR